MDVDESGADVADPAAMEDVPPPPAPVAGPGARRARVQLPEEHDDHGPTYYRLGVDYPVDPDDDEVLHQCARIKLLGMFRVLNESTKALLFILFSPLTTYHNLPAGAQETGKLGRCW